MFDSFLLAFTNSPRNALASVALVRRESTSELSSFARFFANASVKASAVCKLAICREIFFGSRASKYQTSSPLLE